MEATSCILLLMAMCGVARWFLGSWAAPAAAYCAVWAVALIPSILIIPEFISPMAIGLVVSFMLAALAGSLAAEMLPRRDVGEVDLAEADPLQPAAARRGFGSASVVLLLLGSCGLGAAAYYLLSAGYALSEFTRLETWVQLTIRNSLARYSGEVEPFAIRLLLGLNYAGSLLAGVSFARPATRAVRLVAALPLIAGVVVTGLTTAKAGAILCFLFAFSSWLAAHASDRRVRAPRHWTRYLTLPVAVTAAVAAFFGSMAMRYGESADAALLLGRSSSYFIGQNAALSAWLAVDDWSNAPPTLGAYTFAGAFEMLGIAERTTQGLYDPIGLNEWSAESNIYSALRSLITDFGLPVAWVIVAAFSAVAQSCWSLLRDGYGGLLATLVLTTFYAVTFYSPLTSVFAYNVNFLAFSLFAMFIWLFQRRPRASVATGLALPESRA